MWPIWCMMWACLPMAANSVRQSDACAPLAVQVALAARTVLLTCDWFVELESSPPLPSPASVPWTAIPPPPLQPVPRPPGRPRKSAATPLADGTEAAPLPADGEGAGGLAPPRLAREVRWARGRGLSRCASDWEALPRQTARRAARQGTVVEASAIVCSALVLGGAWDWQEQEQIIMRCPLPSSLRPRWLPQDSWPRVRRGPAPPQGGPPAHAADGVAGATGRRGHRAASGAGGERGGRGVRSPEEADPDM